MKKTPPSRKGCIPWNKGKKSTLLWNARKGKKLSEVARHNMSIAHIGKPSPMKGKKQSLEAVEKNRLGHIGKHTSRWSGASIKEMYRFSHARRIARKRGAIGSHTTKEWMDLKRKFNFMCLCCKKQEPEIRLSEDHILPISRGGDDYIDNIQPLCLACNMIKHAKHIDFRNAGIESSAKNTGVSNPGDVN